ncbi:phosphatidic acid phosphatase [Arthrobacter sp.]|uniref:phosphatidic acid phosphatase n=1 Tax=Arthrobacter sp. TaxID=1667 RepID=UPI003A8F3615
MVPDADAPTTGSWSAGSRLAWAVTHALSPAVLVGVYLLLLPLRAPEASWLQGFVAAVFTVGFPWLFLVWMKRRGSVTDLHVRERSQRWPVFVFAAASLLIGYGAEVLLHAPAAVFRAMAVILAGLLVCAVVNLRWKLSVHTAVASLIWLSVFSGPPWGAAIALLLTMVVGWSRVEVRHHTPTQVLAGAVVGSALFLGGLWWS